MTHFSDAICARDVDRSEPEPTDCCLDCGAEIAVGFLHCAACAAVHDERECFDLNFPDLRRG